MENRKKFILERREFITDVLMSGFSVMGDGVVLGKVVSTIF